MDDVSIQLQNIYARLLNHFGPRNWWPADTDFEVIVGAILTQSVSWRNVIRAILNLKALNLMAPECIAACPDHILEEAVRPTRYYRQKAARLKNFCRFLLDEYQGSLPVMFSQDLWKLRKKLLGLKGIGPETADSILLYAGAKPIFVVDTYTRRIFSRLGFFPEDIGYHDMQQFFMRHLPPDVAMYNEYHALIDALGHNLCSSKPKCLGCPVNDICKGREGER